MVLRLVFHRKLFFQKTSPGFFLCTSPEQHIQRRGQLQLFFRLVLVYGRIRQQ